MLGFGVVHGELGAGEFEQPRGHPHVIGMHVGENNLADVGPGDAVLAEGGVERFKGRPGLHSTIDQNEAILAHTRAAGAERDQEDVYGFELKREWKRERKDARINFAKRSQSTPRRWRDRNCGQGVRIPRGKSPFDSQAA